jgi:Bacterial membrane protein YfhO
VSLVKRSYGYVLALLVEVLVFYRQVLFERGYLFPWDFRGVHLPLATFIAASLRRGEMPLWEPYTYCGVPIFANIQAAIFYPPVLLATAASNWFGGDSLPRLLAIAVAAQVFFAGVCTFALLKRLGAHPAAAFAGATVYQLGCFFAVHAEHMGAMHAASWIPLVWLAVVELREGLRWRWMAILAIAVAMAILAGLPQVAVAAVGSAVLIALLIGGASAGVRVAGACVWGALLAAVQIIPTAELTRNSVAKFRAEWLKTGGGIKLGALYTLVRPNYWGALDGKFHGPSDQTFLYLYCSIVGLALALAAALWKPDKITRAFAILTFVAAVWMFGDSTPVGRTIFLALPVSVRIGIHPEYTLPVFALGVAVLAGLGANRFLRPRWQIAVGVIIAIDLLAVGSGRPFNIEKGTTHDALDGSPKLAEKLRDLARTPAPPYRVDMADVTYGWSSVWPILAVPTADGCDPMAPERVIQLRLAFSPGERWGTCYQVKNALSPVLGLANVRYVISKTPVPLPAVEEVEGFTIYENPRVMPRFFFAREVRPAADLADAARGLHAADFDPAQTTIVEGGIAGGARAKGDVRVESYTPNRIVLRTHAESDAFLVAADSWYPGWQAKIDGRPARVYPTDVAFRGVPVPAGDHRVEMRFAPKILWRSAIVSGIALLGVVWAMVRRRGSA